MEDYYYNHLETIKAEKEAEVTRKNQEKEKKYRELLEIQKQEEEELAHYEKSIIMEE